MCVPTWPVKPPYMKEKGVSIGLVKSFVKEAAVVEIIP